MKKSSYVIKFDPFRVSLKVHISDDLYPLCQKYFSECGSREEEEDADGWATPTVEAGWAVIALKHCAGVGAISHEVVHFVNRLFMYIGYEPKPDNDEIQAYLIGYATREITKCMKKHYKKYKLGKYDPLSVCYDT